MRVRQTVHFPIQAVTCISRPPNTKEMKTLLAYEEHNEACNTCSHARFYDSFMDQQLCWLGLYLAQDVTDYLWGGGDGHIYSTALPQVYYFRVEIPLKLVASNKLLRMHRNQKTARERGRIACIKPYQSVASGTSYKITIRKRRLGTRQDSSRSCRN